MAEFTTKRYLDLEGLRSFWGKAKEFIAAGYDVKGAAAQALVDAKSYADGLKTTIDAAYAAADATTLASANAYADGLAKNYDAKGDAAQALVDAKSYTDGKVKDINDAAGLLAGRVSTAEGEIDSLQAAVEVLNGEASVEGSVKKQVADAVAGVVASAPEDLNTLKEIADYIASDKTGAAEMNNKISANATAIETLNGEGAGSVKAAVKAEETRAMGIESGLAERIATLEAEAGLGGEEGQSQTLAEKVQLNSTNIATLMGAGEGSVAKALEDAKSHAETKIGEAVTALKGDVADAYNTLGKLEDAILDEKSRAEGAEAGLQSAIDLKVAKSVYEAKIGEIEADIQAIENGENGILAQAKAYTDAEAGKVYASILAIQTSEIEGLFA